MYAVILIRSSIHNISTHLVFVNPNKATQQINNKVLLRFYFEILSALKRKIIFRILCAFYF
jgi:hypothetical protein